MNGTKWESKAVGFFPIHFGGSYQLWPVRNVSQDALYKTQKNEGEIKAI